MVKKHFLLWLLCGCVLIFIALGLSIDMHSKHNADIPIVIKEADNLGFVHPGNVEKFIRKKLKKSGSGDIGHVLPDLEKSVRNLTFVKSAEIYIKNDNKLYVRITEQEPYCRVYTSGECFYITREGTRLPVLPGKSSPVVIASGEIKADAFAPLSELCGYIYADEFLRNQVVGVRINKEKNKYIFELLLRKGIKGVYLGDISRMGEKTENLKVILWHLTKNDLLEKYRTIDLEFVNHVICLKKG